MAAPMHTVMSPHSVLGSQPAFLKLDRFYVAYTYPIAPRALGRGDFSVGLSAMALLLGAKIVPERSSSSVKLNLVGRIIQFTNGSKATLINGRPFRMKTAAALDVPSHQMLVPLSALISAFHLKTPCVIR